MPLQNASLPDGLGEIDSEVLGAAEIDLWRAHDKERLKKVYDKLWQKELTLETQLSPRSRAQGVLP